MFKKIICLYAIFGVLHYTILPVLNYVARLPFMLGHYGGVYAFLNSFFYRGDGYRSNIYIIYHSILLLVIVSASMLALFYSKRNSIYNTIKKSIVFSFLYSLLLSCVLYIALFFKVGVYAILMYGLPLYFLTANFIIIMLVNYFWYLKQSR